MRAVISAVIAIELLGSAMSAGCSERAEAPTQPTAISDRPGFTSRQANAVRQSAGAGMVNEPRMRVLLAGVTRDLALALADDATRAQVFAAVHSSRIREHKLHFGRLVRGAGTGLLHRIALARGRADAVPLAELDSIAPLEFYMPGKSHFAAWAGGSNLIVASQLADHDSVIGYNLSGNRVALSPDLPPSTPVLVLVSMETNFDVVSAPAFQQCMPSEDNDCGGGGGGRRRWGGPAPHGIYLTQTYLTDTGESWPRGDPELEAMLIGPISDTVTLAKIDCANESRFGERHYDQNTNVWTGNALVADSGQLEAIRSIYPPGTQWQNVRFLIEFWEDDTERCVIATNVQNWRDRILAAAIALYGTYVFVATDFVHNPDDDAWPFVGAVPLGVLALINTIGGNDDHIGEVVSKTAWNPTHPGDQITQNHAVVLDSARVGTATLVWRTN